MEIDPESVKKWLKRHVRSRYWLADQCEVTRGTVNNWLSSPRGIPSKAIIIIEKLIQGDDAREKAGAGVVQGLVLEFTQAEFDRICTKAMEAKKIPRIWAQDVLLKAANEDGVSF